MYRLPFWFAALLVIFLDFVSLRPVQSPLLRNSDGPRVFLTVSSLAGRQKNGTVFQRRLELNWYNIRGERAWIGLFSADPTTDRNALNNPLDIILAKEHPSGSYQTKFSLGPSHFDIRNLQSSCLPYHVAVIVDNKVVSHNCFRSNPNWMWENRDRIGHRTLHGLLLPGTHNAGTYRDYQLDTDTATAKYIYCQDENIENQLIYGIRYLDIRPSYKTVTNNESIWISHDIFFTNNDVRSILKQVKRFLDATKEIVILDLHRFETGFTGRLSEARHREMIDMLIQELGEHMIPLSFGYNKTLNDLWSSNKRLLVGYASLEREKSPLLFPDIIQLWGDKDTKEGLEEYLNSNICSYRITSPWAAMAELTPTTFGVIVDRYGGLRKMAQDVNLDVTRWVRDRWWNCANIVATDFFLGNDLVTVAIESNLKRS